LTSTPCLGERVSGLADGSLPDDVRDRALAHVTGCHACREALDTERLLVDRLRHLPTARPSQSLLDSLVAMGEPGGPMPPRPGRVAGTARQPTAPVVATAPPGRPAHGTRPAGTSRPAGRSARRPSRRSLAVAAAGMIGAGVLTLTGVGGSVPSGPSVRPPVDQLTVNRPVVQRAPTTGTSKLVTVLTPRSSVGPTILPARRLQSGR
jgi:hypothetical protein